MFHKNCRTCTTIFLMLLITSSFLIFLHIKKKIIKLKTRFTCRFNSGPIFESGMLNDACNLEFTSSIFFFFFVLLHKLAFLEQNEK